MRVDDGDGGRAGTRVEEAELAVLAGRSVHVAGVAPVERLHHVGVGVTGESRFLRLDVPDLDVVRSGREDTRGGRVEANVTGFASVCAGGPKRLEVGEVFAVAGPSILEEFFVDAGDGELAVLADGSDEGVVEGRPVGVEDGGRVGAAEGEKVGEL